MSSIVEVSLNEGQVLRVFGPAKADVVAGMVLVVGSKYSAGSSFVVHRLRSYGVKALSPAKLRFALGEGSQVEIARESEEVVDEWLKVSEHVLRTCLEKECRVLVVGPPESGKSTFTAFLANYLRESRVRVGVVEGDVGQEDILVPTAIALAEVSKPVLWLRELEPILFKFVGCTSPQYCYSESILAIRELVDEGVNLGLKAILVNTDGWVNTASGIEHKLTIIRWIKPDVVVAMDKEVYSYLLKCANSLTNVIYAPRPAVVRVRSKEERRELRTQAYRRYFSKGKVRRVKLESVGILNACALSGLSVSREELLESFKVPDNELEKIVYSTKIGDTLYLISREPLNITLDSEGVSRVVVITPKDARGTLVGLLGERMREVGIGVVTELDLSTQELAILTPWEGGIRGLIIGKIKLSEDLEEVGRVARCTL
ncbi:MAG: Clp1/GlmU family protein [Sulfolobales archaeon]